MSLFERGAHGIRPTPSTGFEPKVHYRSDDYDVTRRFVSSGLGVALVPALGQVPGAIATATIADLRVRRHVVALHAPSAVNPAVEGAMTALKAASVEAAGRLPGVLIA